MKYIIKLQKGNTIEVTLPNGIKKKVNTSSQEYKDLYPNLTSKIDDNTYYKNLPEINVTSNKAGEHMVRKALNESGKTMMKGVGTAALVGTGVGGLLTAPLPFIGGMAGGMIGDYLTNKATQKISGGKYQNWEEFAGDKTGMPSEVMTFTNPGAIIGGGIGSSPLFKKGVQSTGKYLINKAEPYLMGDKSIPMMVGYKPKINFIENGVENNTDELFKIGFNQAKKEAISKEAITAHNWNSKLNNRIGQSENFEMKKSAINPEYQSWATRRVEQASKPINIYEYDNAPKYLKDKMYNENIQGINVNQFDNKFGVPEGNINGVVYRKSIHSPKEVGYHEGIHNARGRADGNEYLISESKKLNSIIKGSDNMNLAKTGEIDAYVKEAGFELGYKPGDKYPGFSKFMENVNKNKELLSKKNAGFSVMDFSTNSKAKRIFDIMTRSKYGVGAIVPAAGLYGLTQSQKQGGILKAQEGGLLYSKVNQLINRKNPNRI